MAARDCIDAIREAFRGRRDLSDEEIEILAEEVQRRAGDGGEEAFREAAEQLAAETREAAYVERRNRKINIRAKQRLVQIARDADERYGDPSLGLEAAMVGTNKPLRGGRRSVDAFGKSLANDYIGGMVADLETADLLVHLNSGHLDLDIAKALEKITKPEAPGSQSATATKIAQVIHKHRRRAFDRQNRAGAWQKPLKGFITRQAHDMDRLRRAGFESWRDRIRPLLDDATFEGVGDADEFLREAYKGLSSGVHLRTLGGEANDLKLEFTGPGNLAKRVSTRHRVLHFKSAEAWNDYNTEFGFRNLRESIVHELEDMARNTAMMETFGTNPRAMYEETLRDLKEEFRGEPKKSDRLNRRLLDAEFDVVEGASRIPVSSTFSKVGQGVRAVQSMAKLGGAFISSIADVANKAAAIRYVDGTGVLTPFAESVTTAFDTLGNKNKRIASELLGVGLEGQIGDMAARFSADDSVVGTMNRSMRWYFKLNLLTPWTDANKRGIGLLLSRRLAMAGGQPWEKMPRRMRDLLDGFGLEGKHWEIARQVVRKADDGRRYLFPDEIRNVDAEVFRTAGLDPVTDRDFIENALRAFIHDTVEAAVPTPGARERAILTLGFRPGTPEGEAIRFMAQFKAFPVTVGTKTIGRLRYANPDGGLDRVGLAAFIASTTALGYMAMAAKDLARGRTPRDPIDRETWIASALQGGGFGIYGDFLLGETNRYGRSLLDTLAGPTIGTLADIDELRAKLIAGEDVAASALRVAMQNTPYLNLFYTRTAMDYLVFYHLQEMANPGYLRRMEKRMQREQGQGFVFPPSRAVPRGGDILSTLR